MKKPVGRLVERSPCDKSVHHHIDSVALIEGGAIVNTAGVVAIVSAIYSSPIGPRNGAIVAGRESAPEADGTIGTIATDASASVASTGYGKATSTATRSHPAVCFIACQKESRGGEKNGDSLTEVAL